MTTRALYVGRFQPFHKGHLEVVKHVLKHADDLVLVIGSAQYSHTSYNPFTAGERLVMIRCALIECEIDESKVWIVPVPDIHLHMLWVSAVEGYVPKFDVVYSNEPLTRRLFVEAGYPVEKIPFFERKIYSSTLIREKISKGETWETLVPKSVAEFIKEIKGIDRLKELSLKDNETL